jgi:hypothetical protein
VIDILSGTVVHRSPTAIFSLARPMLDNAAQHNHPLCEVGGAAQVGGAFDGLKPQSHELRLSKATQDQIK